MMIRDSSSSWSGCRTVPHRLPVGFCQSGVPVNPHIILTIKSIHCSAFQLTIQTRSKYGPTLKAGYVVLPVITSRPLRLPYAHHTYLAGVTQLDPCLPQTESCRGAGISGPSSVICHRMPMALPRVPARCLCPLLPWQLWPSPQIYRIGAYPHCVGFVPQSDSPSYIRPMISYEAAPFA